MVKDHSDRERGNLLPPLNGLQQGFFYMHHPTDKIAHTSHGALAGTRNSSIVHREDSIRQPIAPLVNTLTTELHLILLPLIQNWIDPSWWTHRAISHSGRVICVILSLE